VNFIGATQEGDMDAKHIISRLATLIFTLVLIMPVGCSSLGPENKSFEIPDEAMEISIDIPRDQLQGHYIDVPVTVNADITRFSGFEMLVSYDPEALTLARALPGIQLTENNWEYFEYQALHDTVYHYLGLVNIFAAIDVPNIDPTPLVGSDEPDGLFTLRFLVSNDVYYDCEFLPIRFFWRDCEDNLFFSLKGDTLGLARAVYDTSRTEMDEHTHPGWLGPPEECLESLKQAPVYMIDYVNGGIQLTGHCDGYKHIGDLNCNGLAFETADAELCIELLTTGMEGYERESILCATYRSDINPDGIAPSVSDLQYLIQIINGDPIPAKLLWKPVHMNVDTLTDNDTLSVFFYSDYNIGSSLLTFLVDDETQLPTLGMTATNMDLKYHYRNDTLKVLIYSFLLHSIPAGPGEMLTIPADAGATLLSIDLAEMEGRQIVLTDDPIPREFVLLQNYPNPFVASTTIELRMDVFSEWLVTISDAKGRQIREYSGYSDVGPVKIKWDGEDSEGNPVAEGVYFYKATINDKTVTKTMILRH
jgi:hypothetical protein